MLCSFSIPHSLTYYAPAVVGEGTFRIALDRGAEVCDRQVKLPSEEIGVASAAICNIIGAVLAPDRKHCYMRGRSDGSPGRLL